MRSALWACACLILSGCADPIAPRLTETATLISGPQPEMNRTPMAAALKCVSTRTKKDVRIGVSDFTDGTGSYEPTSPNARIVSQRPDMMMIVALSKGGAQLVNRNTVAVSEWELGKALERKLGDGRPAKMGDEIVDFRPVKAGMLLGSTHFVTGSITELNWNIDSGVVEGGAYSAALGARTYRISIAIDIMVTDTVTTQIVHAQSYKKQLVGLETNANFFRFFTQTAVVASIAAGTAAANAASKAAELFNANLTNKKNEPIHGALRWLIEIAAYDILRSLHNTRAECDRLLPAGAMEDEDNAHARHEENTADATHLRGSANPDELDQLITHSLRLRSTIPDIANESNFEGDYYGHTSSPRADNGSSANKWGATISRDRGALTTDLSGQTIRSTGARGWTSSMKRENEGIQ